MVKLKKRGKRFYSIYVKMYISYQYEGESDCLGWQITPNLYN